MFDMLKYDRFIDRDLLLIAKSLIKDRIRSEHRFLKDFSVKEERKALFFLEFRRNQLNVFSLEKMLLNWKKIQKFVSLILSLSLLFFTKSMLCSDSGFKENMDIMDELLEDNLPVIPNDPFVFCCFYMVFVSLIGLSRARVYK